MFLHGSLLCLACPQQHSTALVSIDDAGCRKGLAQKRLVFFIILKNSSSLTSPSPSRSASSIISCMAHHHMVFRVQPSSQSLAPCQVLAATVRRPQQCKTEEHTHLQLLVSHVFAQLLGNALQVLERDLASLVIIKQPEGLQAPDNFRWYWPSTMNVSTCAPPQHMQLPADHSRPLTSALAKHVHACAATPPCAHLCEKPCKQILAAA